jgi:hypothetical protein
VLNPSTQFNVFQHRLLRLHFSEANASGMVSMDFCQRMQARRVRDIRPIVCLEMLPRTIAVDVVSEPVPGLRTGFQSLNEAGRPKMACLPVGLWGFWD